MTAFLLFVVILGLGFALGHMAGFDSGVRQERTLNMLRGAFNERPLRGRATWRRP